MSSPPPQQETTYYAHDATFADLSNERFDHDVAAVDTRRDRGDTALLTNQHISLKRQGNVNEAQLWQWHMMGVTSDDHDAKMEGQEDLHGGQLHRLNRIARGEDEAPEGRNPMDVGFRGGRGGMRGGARGGRGGRGGGRGGKAQWMDQGVVEGILRAAMKPEYETWPQAKGFAEELDADMFCDGPILGSEEM
ncbi:hypothetical protein M011DRAFT_38373 [Sporormia fimetaria CBS 119925]|uniref:Uncharacterized protein n=1 Tax=Sporormia fimetaria CBS 119925 TaxID=1340428 RepID=A0A6A6VDY9_9PLEO|nr:hypothetical protein M011DRAFT_38373 [Sporormia fimetaria CBS 119925]